MKRTFLIFAVFSIAIAGFAQDKYTTKKDVPYTDSGETDSYRKERCKLDIYYPQDKKGFKTIVWFHGGGLEAGSKSIPEGLKNAGIAIVAPNYRLFPHCKCPEYTQDAAKAVAWVRRHIAEFGGDTSQIYVGGHSAGGYLTLMLALDKSYLQAEGVDADSVKGYFPLGGQCATHYTIRKERKISYTLPIIDKYAPLNNARKLSTQIMLMTGERSLEQMARYEENLYLKAVLEGIGNKTITLHEFSGFDHGTAIVPACEMIKKAMLSQGQ